MYTRLLDLVENFTEEQNMTILIDQFVSWSTLKSRFITPSKNIKREDICRVAFSFCAWSPKPKNCTVFFIASCIRHDFYTIRGCDQLPSLLFDHPSRCQLTVWFRSFQNTTRVFDNDKHHHNTFTSNITKDSSRDGDGTSGRVI